LLDLSEISPECAALLCWLFKLEDKYWHWGRFRTLH